MAAEFSISVSRLLSLLGLFGSDARAFAARRVLCLKRPQSSQYSPIPVPDEAVFKCCTADDVLSLPAVHQRQGALAYGRNAEALFLAEYNRANEEPIVGNQRIVVRDLGEHWSIRGRIDGMLGDSCVVEIKHRTGLIRKQPPVADLLQLHLYMWLADKPRGMLVEAVRWKSGASASRVLHVPFNAVFWERCLLSINAALTGVQSLAQPFARDSFALLTHEQQATILARQRLPLVFTPEEIDAVVARR